MSGPIVTKSATAVLNSARNSLPLAVLIAPWISGLVAHWEARFGVELGPTYADQLTAAIVGSIPVAAAWYRMRVIDRRALRAPAADEDDDEPVSPPDKSWKITYGGRPPQDEPPAKD